METRWYVVRTFSGHESKVKTLLEAGLNEHEHLKAKVLEILVPMEKVFEVKDGKKKSKTKNFFPGYILVNVDLDNQVKDFILSTPSVMGFLGTGGNPNPLQPEEVRRIVGRLSQDSSTERMETIFRSGDLVKIIDGPFNNFSGLIEEVNEEKMKIKVMVSIFGRKTPVEIDFVQAEIEK
ncbi:MAG: transcription termination/antitermination factor NusG [Ignavibacteriaceae bacterium]|jgi:transcriptional antiterminator NusG|nr:transcription termination/antitermination factor NusG [Ignavibacteriaceae bacterium]HRN25345.1 transcription termination/antitermination protein NusG [Ignavibacteriaceae bacterium]HRP92506.1 transcription termination/antitermination protein NusG [Ignavibacteriaceae bacterium]HRQ52987.1 transcription termination/antitermination protein NusG [Ignavibacteriaceae bacterium]